MVNTSAFNDAAQAALSAAAQNAASTGVKTSEFWVSVLAAGGAVLAGVLIPGVGGMIVAGVVTAGAAAYSHSRGNVKQSALAGAAAGLAAAASSTNTTLAMAGKAGEAVIATVKS
jgi:hypothetical protein